MLYLTIFTFYFCVTIRLYIYIKICIQSTDVGRTSAVENNSRDRKRDKEWVVGRLLSIELVYIFCICKIRFDGYDLLGYCKWLDSSDQNTIHPTFITIQ